MALSVPTSACAYICFCFARIMQLADGPPPGSGTLTGIKKNSNEKGTQRMGNSRAAASLQVRYQRLPCLSGFHLWYHNPRTRRSSTKPKQLPTDMCGRRIIPASSKQSDRNRPQETAVHVAKSTTQKYITTFQHIVRTTDYTTRQYRATSLIITEITTSASSSKHRCTR